MNTNDISIDFIVRDGQTILLNTRSAQALEAAGIPRSEWNGVNQTGNSFFEDLLNGQLGRNPGAPFDTVRCSGSKNDDKTKILDFAVSVDVPYSGTRVVYRQK